MLETLVLLAEDPERSGAQVRLRADGEAADRLPAEPLDLERVHQDRDGGPLTARVVLVDGAAGCFEILGLGRAHRPSMIAESGASANGSTGRLRPARRPRCSPCPRWPWIPG